MEGYETPSRIIKLGARALADRWQRDALTATSASQAQGVLCTERIVANCTRASAGRRSYWQPPSASCASRATSSAAV
jgi:hypothetical protein